MVGCLSGFADCLFADVVLVQVCGGWFGFVLLLVWILGVGFRIVALWLRLCGLLRFVWCVVAGCLLGLFC